jgi:quinol monooxygenase YgiN
MMDPGGVYMMERFVAKPERVDELKSLLQMAVEQTRQEPGCRQIEAFQDQDNPAKFVVFVIFADQQAVQNHKAAGWHQDIRSRLPGLLVDRREGTMGKAIA